MPKELGKNYFEAYLIIFAYWYNTAFSGRKNSPTSGLYGGWAVPGLVADHGILNIHARQEASDRSIGGALAVLLGGDIG